MKKEDLNNLSRKNSFIKEIFSCFQFPLKTILTNKLLVLKHYSGFTEDDINMQSYFLFEEYIKIINELADEESKKRDEEEKKSTNNNKSSFNPSKIMSGFSGMKSMLGKFKK